ncbi:sensor histidine kinase [Paenibacillus mendelii]|uniref:histidine kinase n=1 Tax=Paenibacillus mendelii TaxID=206163 RepID=A0ABV6JC05_9BACL|nr:HAMP domain-containing sensor histidine kinase [Paenibacillus mendelii]MCQ6559497.1 cell wall metabolism sensor histidine kinase WalK [Paenibacillus mendelii]
MRTNTIFGKLFLSFLLITFLSFGLSIMLSSTFFKSNLRSFIRNGSETMQDRVVDHIKFGYSKGWSRETVIDSLQWGVGGPERAYQFYDGRGQLLYTVGNRGRMIPVAEKFVQDALAGHRVREEIEVNNRQTLFTAREIQDASGLEEKVIISFSFEFDRDVNRFFQPFMLSVLLTIPIAIAIYFVLGRRLSRPLKEMSRSALMYAKGDFSRKVEVRTRDEIGQLGETLNYMAAELASLENARREFLANVSHDLRAPLTSINGFLTAMMDGAIPPEREKHYMEMMKESSDRMMKLVGDLLDMARIEAGQFRLEKVRFNITEQIRKTIARMEPQFVQHQIAVDLDSPEEDLYTVADPDRIDQVLANLLQNAVFYSPAGSGVRVSIKEHNGSTVIAVSDQGIGMTQEELERIWDRFYKGDKARSRKLGTGIGLSIVKHILDRHDAAIRIESEVGRGTVFTITLP